MNVGERESNLHPLNRRKVVGSNFEITAYSHTCWTHANDMQDWRKVSRPVACHRVKYNAGSRVADQRSECISFYCVTIALSDNRDGQSQQHSLWLYQYTTAPTYEIWAAAKTTFACKVAKLAMKQNILRNSMMLAANHQTQLGFPTERITWWQKANIGRLSRKA